MTDSSHKTRTIIPAQPGWVAVNGDWEFSIIAWEMEEGVSLAHPVLPAVPGCFVLRRPDGKYEDNTGVLKEKKPKQSSNNVVKISNIDKKQFK